MNTETYPDAYQIFLDIATSELTEGAAAWSPLTLPPRKPPRPTTVMFGNGLSLNVNGTLCPKMQYSADFHRSVVTVYNLWIDVCSFVKEVLNDNHHFTRTNTNSSIPFHFYMSANSFQDSFNSFQITFCELVKQKSFPKDVQHYFDELDSDKAQLDKLNYLYPFNLDSQVPISLPALALLLLWVHGIDVHVLLNAKKLIPAAVFRQDIKNLGLKEYFGPYYYSLIWQDLLQESFASYQSTEKDLLNELRNIAQFIAVNPRSDSGHDISFQNNYEKAVNSCVGDVFGLLTIISILNFQEGNDNQTSDQASTHEFYCGNFKNFVEANSYAKFLIQIATLYKDHRDCIRIATTNYDFLLEAILFLGFKFYNSTKTTHCYKPQMVCFSTSPRQSSSLVQYIQCSSHEEMSSFDSLCPVFHIHGSLYSSGSIVVTYAELYDHCPAVLGELWITIGLGTTNDKTFQSIAAKSDFSVFKFVADEESKNGCIVPVNCKDRERVPSCALAFLLYILSRSIERDLPLDSSFGQLFPCGVPYIDAVNWVSSRHYDEDLQSLKEVKCKNEDHRNCKFLSRDLCFGFYKNKEDQSVGEKIISLYSVFVDCCLNPKYNMPRPIDPRELFLFYLKHKECKINVLFQDFCKFESFHKNNTSDIQQLGITDSYFIIWNSCKSFCLFLPIILEEPYNKLKPHFDHTSPKFLAT
ncbi:hypothetical protein P9112_003504 [Eukaryota sp. TZLM1-RC]